MKKIKKTMYPKTLRITDDRYVVTEKLDGSNLGIANVNGELVYFTRKWMISANNVSEAQYPELRLFNEMYEDEIMSYLPINTVVFGEWIGQGRIKYKIDKTDMSKRFYAFAFAGLRPDFMKPEAERFTYIKYVHEWKHEELEQPEWINFVPYLGTAETKDEAIGLYREVSLLDNESVSEGLVIRNGNVPRKYVVHKHGK